MSVIATITIPSSAFALGSIVERADATAWVETTVPTSESVIPYLWVPADVAESVVLDLESNPSIERVDVTDDAAGSVLLKLSWTDGVNGILEAIRASDAIVTNAAGTAERWTFQLRFPSYEELSGFYTRCRESAIEIELVQLHEAVVGEHSSQFGLTESQRSLIVAAYEAGYFEVPRRTTLVELGDRLEVSDSAVSQRLRRGLASLIESTVRIEADAGSGASGGPGLEATDPPVESGRDTRR